MYNNINFTAFIQMVNSQLMEVDYCSYTCYQILCTQLKLPESTALLKHQWLQNIWHPKSSLP